MKSKSLSIIQSLVFVLLFTLGSAVANAGDTPPAAGGTPGFGGISDKANAQNNCMSISEKITVNQSLFSSYCGSTTDASECKSNIQDCLSNNNDESLDSSSSGDSTDNSSQCYAFGYQNYKSDLKDMRQTERDSRKTYQDLLKQQTDAKKDYNDQKAKLTQDFQSATDDYNKQAMQDKDDQRKQQQDQKSQQDSLNKQIRDLQMQILQAQNQQALLTSQRGTQIDDYKMKLLQCKADTQKYQQQVKNNTLGGLAALSVKGGGATNDVNTFWQSCVSKVLKTRDDDANKYSVAMNQLSAQITQSQQQLNDSQQSMQLMQTQTQQQNADSQTKTQQQFQSYQAKQKNINQQLQDLFSNFQTQSIQLAQETAVAKQDNTIDSNSLKTFQGQSPPKTDTNANDAYKALSDAKGACGLWQSFQCGSASGDSVTQTCSNLLGKGKSRSGSSSGSTTATP